MSCRPRYRRWRTGQREADITIADLGEFGLIAAIAELMPGSQELIAGIGDDAAVLRAPDGRVVAATDLLVEGRHFRRDWSAPADIGAKAAARNLADIAAMGARPTALLVGLAAPGDLDVEWVLDLARGLAAEAAGAGACVAGGDTCAAAILMLAVTALGDLGGRAPVGRGGARPGDVVAVAGELGSSAAGQALLAAGLPDGGSADLAELVGRHRRPRPPYPAGPEAAMLGATAMIDVSDGLVADLGHVAEASGVRIAVSAGALGDGPARSGALREAAGLLGRDSWLDWALRGGEDHALAATFPAGTALPPGWPVIGTVTAGRGVLVDGVARPDLAGWDHFGPRPAD